MMKLIVGLFVLATAGYLANGELTCSLRVPEVSTEWIDLNGTCLDAMHQQIRKEISASGVYLAMGAYFSRDYVNRPGFAEHFFTAAKEERDHGSKLIEYLSMRGQLTAVTNLISLEPIAKQEWTTGLQALEDALDLEIEVTKSIRNLIEICESSEPEKSKDGKNNVNRENKKIRKSEGKVNYYHLVDYLTGVYLEEQLHGQRELAGKISTLKKMMDNHGPLGEFLFDKNNM